LSRLDSTTWVDLRRLVGEQLADAATPEHRLGDQRRLGPVPACFDQRFELRLLHAFLSAGEPGS
jgi:hypothetical protein